MNINQQSILWELTLFESIFAHSSDTYTNPSSSLTQSFLLFLNKQNRIPHHVTLHCCWQFSKALCLDWPSVFQAAWLGFFSILIFQSSISVLTNTAVHTGSVKACEQLFSTSFQKTNHIRDCQRHIIPGFPLSVAIRKNEEQLSTPPTVHFSFCQSS